MRRLMSGSSSSSINGPVFVNLPDTVSVHISKPVGANEEPSVHREHDNSDGPTVDEVIITPDSHTVRDDFRREVIGRPTHRLYREKREMMHVSAPPSVNANKQRARERTLSIVRLSTALARPKSATLTIGGSSFVRSTFCGMKSVSQSSMGENSTEMTYLGFEIAMCDALGVDILQARNVRVGRAHSVEGVLKARNTFER